MWIRFCTQANFISSFLHTTSSAVGSIKTAMRVSRGELRLLSLLLLHTLDELQLVTD
jgi:hypothetical protein